MRYSDAVARWRRARSAFATVAAFVALGAPRGAFGLGANAMPGSTSIDRYFDRGFALSPAWSDGKAEVSRYGGRETRGGLARDAERIVIVRCESHRLGAWVRADDVAAPALVEVLKVDELYTVQTGLGSERQMLSSVFTRRELMPVRTVFTSQDWMGQTWKELVRSNGVPAELQYSSCWDGEARGTRSLNGGSAGAVLFDDLVVLLRALRVDAPESFTLEVIPSLVSSRVGDTTSEPARIETRRGEPLRVAGRNWHARRADVYRGERVDTLWFDDDGAGPLLRWRKPDGTTWSLLETARLAHWRWAHPGDSLESAAAMERAKPVIPPGPR